MKKLHIPQNNREYLSDHMQEIRIFFFARQRTVRQDGPLFPDQFHIHLDSWQ